MKITIQDTEYTTRDLARSMDAEQMAGVIDDWLNNIAREGFNSGKEIGHTLRTTHRTLQRSAVLMAFGILAGLAEQDYTDPRNEDAIKSAKVVAQMLAEDKLSFGRFI